MRAGRQIDIRFHSDVADRMEHIGSLPSFYTNCNRNRQTQTSAVDIRLHFVSLRAELSHRGSLEQLGKRSDLQSKIKVRLRRHEKRWNVIKTILLLSRPMRVENGRKLGGFTRKLLIYEKELVSLESWT